MNRTVAPILLLLFLSGAQAPAPPPEFDLVVYGGTSAGVIAAVQAKTMGKTVVIVGPDKHLGGLSSGGLGFTDTGNKAVIGGLSREFYHRIWQHYNEPDAWKWQKREEYGNKGQGTPAIDGAQRTMWIFEPHVAEQVFEDLVKEYQIPVHRDEWLDRAQGRRRRAAARITVDHHAERQDATPGGCSSTPPTKAICMAAAGVDYHVGARRKPRYGEKWNGVQTGVLHHRHHFGVLKEPISPYVVPGDPDERRAAAHQHRSRRRVRRRPTSACRPTATAMCLTDHPENRIPFPKPDGYDPTQYELLLRVFDAGWRETFDKFDPDPQPQDRHQQPRPVQHRQHRLNYDYPEASLRAPPRDPQGARDLSEGLALLHRQRPARAEGRAGARCASGACRRTSSPTTAAGRTRSTSARRGA